MQLRLLALALVVSTAHAADPPVGRNRSTWDDGMWYPQLLRVRNDGYYCTIDPLFEGVATLDDVRDGAQCHVDRETGDMCMHPIHMNMMAFASIDRTADTSKDNFTDAVGAGLSAVESDIQANGYCDPENQAGGNCARINWPRTSFLDGNSDDNYGPFRTAAVVDAYSAGILRIDGNDVKYLKNGYSGLTGLDLRGLRSACGNMGNETNPYRFHSIAETPGTMMNNDKREQLSPVTWASGNQLGAIQINDLDNLLFVDLSDLESIGFLEIVRNPVVESVNLDSLIYMSRLDLIDNPSIRSMYMPNWVYGHRLDMKDNINLMDFIAPRMQKMEDPEYFSVAASKNPNLHFVVLGCLHAGHANSNPTRSYVEGELGLQSDYDYIDFEYLETNLAGIQFLDEEGNDNDAPFLVKDLGPEIDAIRDPTQHRNWTEVYVGSSQAKWTNEENPLHAGYGYIEYCGSDVFQYDRTHDFGDFAKEFRMNVRCDITRNREQKALGHKFSAVVEVQNAAPHKQVLLAWSRNSGNAEWSPSPKCTQSSALRSIDEDAGQMARGRADADGYVKFRQYLEKCDTYVYQAIANPQASDCKLSKMIYGQSNRGDALTQVNNPSKGGRAKYSLRPYDEASSFVLDDVNSWWPEAEGMFPNVEDRENPNKSGSVWSEDSHAILDGVMGDVGRAIGAITQSGGEYLFRVNDK